MTQVEKGEKKLKSTDVLLRLEQTRKVKEIIANYQELTQGQDGARANLTEVVTYEQRQNFRCCYWGDVGSVAPLMQKAPRVMTVAPVKVVVKGEDGAADQPLTHSHSATLAATRQN